MNLIKKFYSLLLIFLIVAVAGCSESEQCIEANQFDVEQVTVESNPDGHVYGDYNDITGGQRVDWTDSGLLTNGEAFIVKIMGAWSPWNADSLGSGSETEVAQTLNNLPSCNFCAKKANSPNCLCFPNQDPASELITRFTSNGTNVSSANNYDCSLQQNNPVLCTCTKQYGSVLDSDVFFFPLDFYNKQQVVKNPDLQNVCKYDRGMGLYIGLFGDGGVTYPENVYHMFTLTSTCNFPSKLGKCVDSFGNDATIYIYKSPDNMPITSNKTVKLIINDSYYSDNFGKYDVTFLSGVGNPNDPGLLEYLVSIVEDQLLGKKRSDGTRVGGIIKFMYNSIVQDSGFSTAVRVLMSLYIAIYGLATLIGIAELNKKELMSRLLKISLVMFFVSPTSWSFYNDIVVHFFKDGMDSVIAIFSSFSDQFFQGRCTDVTFVANGNNVGNSARFAFPDAMIKIMLSDASTRKILSLTLGEPFLGLIYVLVIYFLIFFFIYTMLFFAFAYMVNLVKIIFALSLGPIFICFTFFSHTNEMFKKWLAFLGARSLEIVMLFLVLYSFLCLLKQYFYSILAFKACYHTINFGIASFKVLKSEDHYSLINWGTKFINFGGLTFITYAIGQKVASIAGQLISIGGVANRSGSGIGHGESGFAAASSMLSTMKDVAKSKIIKPVARRAAITAIRTATAASRNSGLSDKIDAIGEKIPFSGIRTKMRQVGIERAIKDATINAQKKGLSGTALDAEVRKTVVVRMQNEIKHNTLKSAIKGLDNRNLLKDVNRLLVDKKLNEFVGFESKRLNKEKPDLYGSAYSAEMSRRIKAFSGQNFSAGSMEGVQKYLDTKKKYLEGKALVNGPKTAAKHFDKDADKLYNYAKYLQNETFTNYKEGKSVNGVGIFKKQETMFKKSSDFVKEELRKISEERFGGFDSYAMMSMREKYLQEVKANGIGSDREQFFKRQMQEAAISHYRNSNKDKFIDLIKKKMEILKREEESEGPEKQQALKALREEYEAKAKVMIKDALSSQDLRRTAAEKAAISDFIENRAKKISGITKFDVMLDKAADPSKKFLYASRNIAAKAANGIILVGSVGIVKNVFKVVSIEDYSGDYLYGKYASVEIPEVFPREYLLAKAIDDQIAYRLQMPQSDTATASTTFAELQDGLRNELSSGFVPDKLDVGFGASVNATLLQGQFSDALLKGDIQNVLLGGKPISEVPKDLVADKISAASNQVYAESKLKMSKYELAFKENELRALEAKADKTDDESRQIQRLKQEVGNLEVEVTRQESDVRRIKGEIALIDSAIGIASSS